MKALTVSSYFATFFSAPFCCKLMKLSITELAVSFQHLFAYLANPDPFGILSNHPAFCVGKETFLLFLSFIRNFCALLETKYLPSVFFLLAQKFTSFCFFCPFPCIWWFTWDHFKYLLVSASTKLFNPVFCIFLKTNIYLRQLVTVGPVAFLVLAKKPRFPLVPHQQSWVKTCC